MKHNYKQLTLLEQAEQELLLKRICKSIRKKSLSLSQKVRQFKTNCRTKQKLIDQIQIYETTIGVCICLVKRYTIKQDSCLNIGFTEEVERIKHIWI